MAWKNQKRKAKPKPYQSFSNKTMRCIDPNKPHIQLINNWYRVSPMPKRCDLATRDKWLEAHGHIRKLNVMRHFPE